MIKGRSSVAFSAYAKVNFKVMVIGPKQSGKTACILRYIKANYNKGHVSHNGIEFYSKTLEIEEE